MKAFIQSKIHNRINARAAAKANQCQLYTHSDVMFLRQIKPIIAALKA
jgi:hypothetical protein